MSGEKPVRRDPRQQACRDLIDQIAQGDEAALASLYDLTSPVVFGLAARILHDPRDAEESTLEVYLQVWRTAADYDAERGSPLAWLATMARTRAIDRLRASRRWTQSMVGLDTDFTEPSSGPAELLMSREREAQVRRALDALKPDQRAVLTIAYLSGSTHVEIARKLDLPLGTVKTRIRTGMMQLRSHLSELEGDL